jgi:hypothetical protein
MIDTNSSELPENIIPIQTNRGSVNAFRILGKLHQADMEFMGRLSLSKFKAYGSVDMILIFSDFEGLTIGAAFDPSGFMAGLKALKHVAKYAVVGLPQAVAAIIETSDHITPMDARTFTSAQIDLAWEFIDAKPIEAPTGLSTEEWNERSIALAQTQLEADEEHG